jgi:hypothetical protein
MSNDDDPAARSNVSVLAKVNNGCLDMSHARQFISVRITDDSAMKMETSLLSVFSPKDFPTVLPEDWVSCRQDLTKFPFCQWEHCKSLAYNALRSMKPPRELMQYVLRIPWLPDVQTVAGFVEANTYVPDSLRDLMLTSLDFLFSAITERLALSPESPSLVFFSVGDAMPLFVQHCQKQDVGGKFSAELRVLSSLKFYDELEKNLCGALSSAKTYPPPRPQFWDVFSQGIDGGIDGRLSEETIGSVEMRNLFREVIIMAYGFNMFSSMSRVNLEKVRCFDMIRFNGSRSAFAWSVMLRSLLFQDRKIVHGYLFPDMLGHIYQLWFPFQHCPKYNTVLDNCLSDVFSIIKCHKSIHSIVKSKKVGEKLDRSIQTLAHMSILLLNYAPGSLCLKNTGKLFNALIQLDNDDYWTLFFSLMRLSASGLYRCVRRLRALLFLRLHQLYPENTLEQNKHLVLQSARRFLAKANFKFTLPQFPANLSQNDLILWNDFGILNNLLSQRRNQQLMTLLGRLMWKPVPVALCMSVYPHSFMSFNLMQRSFMISVTGVVTEKEVRRFVASRIAGLNSNVQQHDMIPRLSIRFRTLFGLNCLNNLSEQHVSSLQVLCMRKLFKLRVAPNITTSTKTSQAILALLIKELFDLAHQSPDVVRTLTLCLNDVKM